MAISQGVDRQLYWKNETTWADTALVGTNANATRRVTVTPRLEKDIYRSAEIAGHLQQSDVRHGSRRAMLSWNTELAPGSLDAFIGAALRKYSWVTNSTLTGLTFSSAAAGAPMVNVFDVTSSVGTSFLTGLKVGTVAMFTTGTGLSTMLNKNFVVINITSATVMRIAFDPNLTVTNESCTGATGVITIAGKTTYAPGTAQDNPIKSFAIEDWHPISGGTLSERYWGMRVSQLSFNMPPTGMATMGMEMIGKNMTTSGTQWAATPTAASTAGVCAAVNGIISAGATPITLSNVTSMSLQVQTGVTGAQVVGSNVTPDLFQGRVMVTGQIQAFFENGTLRDEFLNETESQLVMMMRADGAADGDFFSICLPRVKWTSASKDDGEKGVVQTVGFEGLYYSSGGASAKHQATSIFVHSSDAP